MENNNQMTFEQAEEKVRNEGYCDNSSQYILNDVQLDLYALYKQATVGDVEGNQPWAVQFEARSKWDAWNGKKGMPQDEAKKQYIALVQSLIDKEKSSS
jgi:acyl-CoA-binding protein